MVRSWRHATDRSPMRDVSWSDAVQYTEWLKKTTQPAVPAADRGRMGVCRAREFVDTVLVGKRTRHGARQLQGMRRRLESRSSRPNRLVSAELLRHLRYER